MRVWNTHPEEIMLEMSMSHNAMRHTPPYSCLQVLAEREQPHSMSRSILELEATCYPSHVFQCLYPNQISPAGLPTGLDHVNTRLTTYNGSHIPLYGALWGPITWQQDCPGACPHRVKSYWYIADTPGPAILGLPSSEKLAVVKMNCAITIRQPSTHAAPVSTTAAMTKPATVPEAAKPIRSNDDLINEFPDQFKGIGRSPSKYKIWLHHDAHPMIHAPRKCPITLHPKVKEHLDKMECLGVITHVDEPTDWVSSITYIQKANGKLHLCLDPRDLNEAICHHHHKMPTVEEVDHKFAHSHFFTKLDACHGYWSIVLNQTPTCSLLSTVPLVDTASCDSPLVWSVPKTSSRKRCIRSSKNAKDLLELQTTSLCMATLRWNMMPAYEISCKSPANTTWCSTHRRHVLRPKLSISLDVSMMPMESTWTQARSMQYMPCQHPQMSLSSKNS